MIKIDIKGLKPAELLRAAMVKIEKQITTTAKSAALRHGGVTVRFAHKPDGTIRSVELQGSQAAIDAAKAAIER